MNAMWPCDTAVGFIVAVLVCAGRPSLGIIFFSFLHLRCSRLIFNSNTKWAMAYGCTRGAQSGFDREREEKKTGFRPTHVPKLFSNALHIYERAYWWWLMVSWVTFLSFGNDCLLWCFFFFFLIRTAPHSVTYLKNNFRIGLNYVFWGFGWLKEVEGGWAELKAEGRRCQWAHRGM